MDPLSAVGVGLGATSLIFQAFAGCIKGYQLFVEINGMPSTYQHLCTRLRIEQARLLTWGEQVGLVEELLHRPSRVLELNQNIVLDILFQVQLAFKECIKIRDKYDFLVSDPSSNRTARDGKVTGRRLREALALLEKKPQLASQPQWAMVKRETFEKLVAKLIAYNEWIESLLDRAALGQLQVMHEQTHMMMLQLTSKVDELRVLSKAIHISAPTTPSSAISRSSTLLADRVDSKDMFARLADFKAQQISLDQRDSAASGSLRISGHEIRITNSNGRRPQARYREQHVWIEWKDYFQDSDPGSSWYEVMEDRVQRLTSLLGSSNMPSEFRTPPYLGYLNDTSDAGSRFGIVYEIPNKKSDESDEESAFVSLRERITQSSKPSLTTRVRLSHVLAQSLMYLHSVNWLHKGLCSDNVVFFSDGYDEPTLSGFDHARPNFPEEATERVSRRLEFDVYRHPDDITLSPSTRSKKSYDTYSLGIVLVEIAYWEPIERIMQIFLDKKGATSMVGKIRPRLLNTDTEPFMNAIECHAGHLYRQVVQRCLQGGKEIGIADDSDEESAEAGVEMQRVFLRDVVCGLSAVKV